MHGIKNNYKICFIFVPGKPQRLSAWYGSTTEQKNVDQKKLDFDPMVM
jgi:hypothetical protein